MISALLIFKSDVLQQVLSKILQSYYNNQLEIRCLPTLQEAIEDLEQKKTKFDLIVFEHQGTSLTMSKILFELGSGAKFIMCDDEPIDITELQGEYTIERILLKSVELEIPKMIKKFEIFGHLPAVAGIDDAYVSVKPDIVASYCPLNQDVYIKLGDGKFVKLFHKGDPIERADFDKYQNQKGVDLFFFKKTEYIEVLNKQVKRLEVLAGTSPIPEATIIKEVVKSHAAVKDLVKQMGFTQEAQTIAKASVAMTAKIIGSKPKLSKILNDLKKKDGDYVSGHSVALGSVACAIAHKMGWNSASTYFKLSLAAFMHDITLDDKLAKVESLRDASMAGTFQSDELVKIKLHTVHAADYVRKMNEIPSDVDQIVFQHHEKPDGTGFPRNLSGKFISPLATVFIVAHDVLDFMNKHGGESMDGFLDDYENMYKAGNFRKIWLALKADTKL